MRTFAPWLMLVLVSPAAAAASVATQTWSATDANLDGALSLRAGAATLDLSLAVGAGAPVAIAWTSARGIAHEEAGIRWATGSWTPTQEPREVPLAWAEGSLVEIRCPSACDVLLVAGGGEADRLGLEGNGSARLGPRTRDAPLQVASSSAAAAVRVAMDVPRDALVASAPGGSRALAPVVEGRAILLLWNATATIATAAGRETLVTGERREPVAGPAPAGERIETRFVRVELEGVRVEAPGAPVSLAAPRVEVVLDGVLEAPRVTGHVEVEGRRHELRDARLRVEGALRAVASVAPALSGPPASDAARARTAADAAGDARSVRIDGTEAVSAPRAGLGGAGAAVAGAAGLGVLLAVALRLGALTALYSRITRGRVLLNPNRRALYALVLAQPGVHVAQLVRETGLGKVVVRHHLRVLESHRFLVARAAGRVRVYYPAGLAPAADDLHAHVALKDASRRLVLEAVAASAEGGLSQRDLVERTGFSQRLVSYHLRRLEEAGLVRGDGGRPQRFRAAASPPSPPAAGS